MMSKITAVASNPNGKTISIGCTGCPRNLALLSMLVDLSAHESSCLVLQLADCWYRERRSLAFHYFPRSVFSTNCNTVQHNPYSVVKNEEHLLRFANTKTYNRDVSDTELLYAH